MRILVSGANGFVGHHLVEALKSQNHETVATGMDADLAPELMPFVSEYYGNCDLTNAESVSRLPLETVGAIINLAGLAQVGSSFGAEEKYQRINVGVHTTLADELLRQGLKDVRVIAISTGAVYDSHQPMPQTEESRLLKNGSPYALSKIAMEKALGERREKGLDIVVVRPFNHIGPGQLPGFLIPELVQQLQSGNKIVAGDLSTVRDYTDVRDVVKAYILLATSPELHHPVYNVCSGTSRSGKTMLDQLAKAFGINSVSVEIDQSRIRPDDPKEIYGSSQRLKDDTGWQPTIPLEKTIEDIAASSSG